MYHHLKIAEQGLTPSGKDGEQIEIKHGGRPIPYKKIGFTIAYSGDVDKLINGIIFNIKKHGIFIPNKFRYIVRPSQFAFKDNFNDTVWSVNIQKSRRVRYFNFQTEIQCSR